MDLELYQKLSTCSRRAIKRKSWRGRPYTYKPRGPLLARLSREKGMSVQEIYRLLLEEREFLLNQLP